MERPPRYHPLSGDDEEEILAVLEEKEGTAWNANSTEIIPTNTLSFVIYLSILLLSLSANVLLVLSNAKLRISQAPQTTAFSGLKFDTLTTYHALTDYWRPNATDEDMEAAWDSINTDRMAVALEDEFAKKAGLPASTRFPWDTERSVYYLKGIHDLHCLKLVRKAIATKHRGDNTTFSLNHIYHCLEGLRQDIMCMADDTPMPALPAHHFGDGQVRKCRNWDRMVAWASESERHACYEWDDYREATNSLELFAHCPPGSPYRDFQQAYFAYHGHKDTYEVKDGGEPTVIF